MRASLKRAWRLLTPLYLCFLDESQRPATTTKTSTVTRRDDFSTIRCPLCKWQPKESSRWYCGDCDYPEYFFEGCGTAWNSFKTRGLCPGCGHQWRWTVCLSCYGWSKHNDWYVH